MRRRRPLGCGRRCGRSCRQAARRRSVCGCHQAHRRACRDARGRPSRWARPAPARGTRGRARRLCRAGAGTREARRSRSCGRSDRSCATPHRRCSSVCSRSVRSRGSLTRPIDVRLIRALNDCPRYLPMTPLLAVPPIPPGSLGRVIPSRESAITRHVLSGRGTAAFPDGGRLRLSPRVSCTIGGASSGHAKRELSSAARAGTGSRLMVNAATIPPSAQAPPASHIASPKARAKGGRVAGSSRP